MPLELVAIFKHFPPAKANAALEDPLPANFIGGHLLSRYVSLTLSYANEYLSSPSSSSPRKSSLFPSSMHSACHLQKSLYEKLFSDSSTFPSAFNNCNRCYLDTNYAITILIYICF